MTRQPENVIEMGLLGAPPEIISGSPGIPKGGLLAEGNEAPIYLNSILNWLSLK